jgi:hypothetical protein
MRTTICVRKRRLILVLGLCALGVVPCQGRQNHPSDQDLDRNREMGGAFAFANRAGTELLVTDENASGNNDVVKTFSKAVCPGNKGFCR